MEPINLINFQNQEKQYFLEYSPLPYWIGFILGVFLLIFGTIILYFSVSFKDIKLAFIEPELMSSLLIITLTLTYFSIFCAIFILPKYIKSCSHKDAWYLCFQPQVISVNLRHCRYITKLSCHDNTILPIPVNGINWIRKAVFNPRSLGRSSVYYVDVQLTDIYWQKAKSLAGEELDRMRNIKAIEQDFTLEFLDDNIIRIRLDRLYWPETVSEVWDSYGYKISQNYNISYREIVSVL